MIEKNIKYLLLIVSLVLSSFSFAQDVKFSAAASHTEVNTGDRFQIQFTANAKVSNFKAPDLSDFRVLSGPNQATNMSWVNGNMTTSISFSYVLMAVKEGTFTIKPALAAVDGAAYKTNSLTITVGKGVNVQQQQQSNKTEETVNVSKVDVSKDLFIKSSVSKSKVYQGEYLVATYQLFTKVNIVANELVKNADLNGFWSQEIDLGQAQWSQEVIGGYRWNVATIRKIVLFPQRSGSLTIDPLEMKFVIQRRATGGGNSVFDQFFGRVENVEYNLKSEPIKITVIPHPENKPASFNGAVGQFEFTSNITTNKVKANEAVNIKFRVAGKGNLPLVDKLTIDFPKDFETYDPKIVDNYKTSANGVSGYKEFDYLIIPRHAGTFTIDPIEFSYFDPATKKFKTLKSQPFTIEVEKGEGGDANVTYSGANKEDVQLLGEDIRYIFTGNILVSHTETSFYNSWMFYVSLLLTPLIFLLVLVFRNKIRTAQSDIVGLRSKKASKMANKHLASAKKSLAAHQQKQFYEDISKALFGYTSDKLKIPLSELNKENIAQKLTTVNVTAPTIDNLIATLEMCEMARFAPVAVAEQEIFSKTETIINQLEKEVRL